MTKEDKQLLLKDLCARVPYGVSVKWKTARNPAFIKNIGDEKLIIYREYSNNIFAWECCIEDIKPYLRPMSSMTSKEWLEYCDACVEDEKSWTWARTGKQYRFTPITHREEFLNAHHFDYRELIPMGLALKAPKDMYKTK